MDFTVTMAASEGKIIKDLKEKDVIGNVKAEAEARGDDALWSGVGIDESSIEAKEVVGPTPVDDETGFDINIIMYAGGGIAAMCLIAGATWIVRHKAWFMHIKPADHGDLELASPVSNPVVGRATLTLSKESQNNTVTGESLQGAKQ